MLRLIFLKGLFYGKLTKRSFHQGNDSSTFSKSKNVWQKTSFTSNYVPLFYIIRDTEMTIIRKLQNYFQFEKHSDFQIKDSIPVCY